MPKRGDNHRLWLHLIVNELHDSVVNFFKLLAIKR